MEATRELTEEQAHDLQHARCVGAAAAYCVGLSIGYELGLRGAELRAFAEAQKREVDDGQH